MWLGYQVEPRFCALECFWKSEGAGWLVCFLIFKEMNYPAISHFKHSGGRDSADRYGKRQSCKALALNH